MAKKDVELMKLVQATEESIQSSNSIHFLNDMEVFETKREKSLALTNVGRKKTHLQCGI
jgi:hypothetical protein